MNNIVKNAIAAHRAVAKNALTVEDQRANEEDKKKLRDAVKAIDAKGAKLAQKINAYYKAIDGIVAEQKVLEQEVKKLKDEGKAAANPFFGKERLFEDREASDMIAALEFNPKWAEACRRGSLNLPGMIRGV